MRRALVILGAVAALLLAAVQGAEAQTNYELVVSASSNRSSPVQLEGYSASGSIYVFTRPTTGVSQVRFYLDDPAMSGAPRLVEKGAPHDFVGTASSGAAKPFNTTTVANGTHTITAAIDLKAGGTTVRQGRFEVVNGSPSQLTFDRTAASFAVQPGGSAAAKTAHLSTKNGAVVPYAVSDDAAWLQATPASGLTPQSLTLAADPAGLGPGTYTATVTATATGHTSAQLKVTLYVRNSLEPDQVHLAWTANTATTLTALWRTWDLDTLSTVQYRPRGASSWSEVTGALRPSGTAGRLHQATLSGLIPASEYEYRVRGDAGWSEIYEARTAPAAGPADFDAIYVADTGLVGRPDGLATGTAQVIDEIGALDPDLVLLGGDYAYFDTDKRFGTLENTIDAWFNQMQPIGSRRPMMPTYGNHEVLLHEGFAPWAARFATPAGFDGARNYSFDVGDVHFVSLLAVEEQKALSSATVSWLEQDVAAAKAGGSRSVVPFFHVSPFADGSSHPSNLALRAQLGPLFERMGVKIAISSHDQSYERTFPLTGVPATNTPTSAALDCYTRQDGVTWIKTSPGGKLSSKNGNFSKFQTFPPPSWTAFRDDTMHHFTRLHFSSSGSIRVETYALKGDGSPPIVQDVFEYRDTCPNRLEFQPAGLSFSAEQGGSAAPQSAAIRTSDGGAVDWALSDNASWLTATPSSGSTPANVSLSVDPAGLAPGTYEAVVSATATGFQPAKLNVTLTVNQARRLVSSTSSSRSGPATLHGATLSGRRYIFLTPESGVSQVRFYLDDPARSGTPRKIENNAPWDFAGTASNNTALPFDTVSIPNGSHTITAAFNLTGGGTQVAEATFVVSN